MKKRYSTTPIDGQKLKEQMKAAAVSATKYVLEKKPERGKPEQTKDESQEQTKEQGGHIPDNFTIWERQLYRIIYEAARRAMMDALGGE